MLKSEKVSKCFVQDCGNENNEKTNKHIHASAGDLLHIRIGNLNWWKCHEKAKREK